MNVVEQRDDPQASLRVVPTTVNRDYGDGFLVPERRYVMIDADGVIVDDAQGYGYTSTQAAHKAMWYKFKGGKKKIADTNAAGKRYWRDKKQEVSAIQRCIDSNCKEIALGEVTIRDVASWVEQDLGVSLDLRMVEWLVKQ